MSLNGTFQCFTPCTLQTLPIGKQLVRIVATSGHKAFDGLMDKLAGERCATRA